MTLARHLDALAVYRASAVRILPTEGDPEDQLDEGGGLEDTFEDLGRAPLLQVLCDPGVAAVLLSDGELSVEAERIGNGGQLRVAWDGQVVLEEEVTLPPIRARARGPWFRPKPSTLIDDLDAALANPSTSLYAVADGADVNWYGAGLHGRGIGARLLRGTVAPVLPEALGAASFRQAHGVRLAYVAGAMAGGISSVEMVVAMAKAGLLGFYGAGGLPLDAVKAALDQIVAAVPAGSSWGANLLHNPTDPALEEQTVDLFLEAGVRRVSASAYMMLTPAVVRYRLTGIHERDGQVVCPHHVFAKISRPEVAERFLSPAPPKIVAELVKRGVLTEAQALLAQRVPVASDLTTEGDSGGHTDRRPLLVLLPLIQRLRDRLVRQHGYRDAPRVGAAGGLGEPASIWAVLAMGADYVLTGSVNQACPEAGTSDTVKQMLRQAAFSDVTTGPAPDMFEIGAEVQVLSRGTMYARRARKLYELYKRYPSMEAIPEAERRKLEKQLFKAPLAEVWEGTRKYWRGRDRRQADLADEDPHHRMALTFRWYLGMTSRWARVGDPERKRDYQIWCGAAIGGFNDWAAEGPLDQLAARGVVAIADGLMEGAAVEARRAQLRSLLP